MRYSDKMMRYSDKMMRCDGPYQHLFARADQTRPLSLVVSLYFSPIPCVNKQSSDIPYLNSLKRAQ